MLSIASDHQCKIFNIKRNALSILLSNGTKIFINMCLIALYRDKTFQFNKNWFGDSK